MESKRCPLMGSTPCLREECAFFDSTNEVCCITTIAKAIDNIAADLPIDELTLDENEGLHESGAKED